MAGKEVDPMRNPEAPGNAVIAFETGDIPHVLSQIARLGEGLKAEFDLIAGRMSWLVIAESFIFSTFATATASYRPDHPLAGVLRYLCWILPLVGDVHGSMRLCGDPRRSERRRHPEEPA
jgi:hypothetical protein